MPTAAYIFSTLDDEPIVPTRSDFLINKEDSTELKRRTPSFHMDHQTTSTTLRTSNKKPTAQDDLEELELDSFIKYDKKDDKNDDIIIEEAQTLNKRDYGNFALLVTLCKFCVYYYACNPPNTKLCRFITGHPYRPLFWVDPILTQSKTILFPNRYFLIVFMALFT